MGRCQQVADMMRGQPGFLSVGVWVTPDNDAVVTTGAFDSEESFRALAGTARELGATPDSVSELEVKPRQVQFLLLR